MIPFKTVYDYYIDRQKMIKQKKPVWAYSTSLTYVGQNNEEKWILDKQFICAQFFSEYWKVSWVL